MRKTRILSHISTSVGLKDMKQLWSTSALVILLLTPWSGALRAQTGALDAPIYKGSDDSTPATPTITMTTTASVGSYIMLSVEGEGDIEVEGAELEYGGIAKVKAPQITIRGRVTSLDCSEAQLTRLDLSKASSLISLWCSNNALTELDTRALSNLSILYCIENQLSALDVTANTKLTELNFSQNKLTQIDLAQCGALTHFLAYHNQIAEVDLSHNPLLIGVDLSENKLTELSVSNNTKLETIYCNGNAIKGQAMERLVASLPDRNDRTDLCHLFAIDMKNESEQNVILKKDVQDALAKHWQTLDYSDGDNDGAGIPYEGITSNTVITSQKVKVYRDRTTQMLYVTGLEPREEVSLYLATGELLVRTLSDSEGSCTIALSAVESTPLMMATSHHTVRVM